MAAILQHVRGVIASVLGYTPAAGELVLSDEDLTFRIGDGALAGGWSIKGHPVVSVTGTSHTVATSDQGKLLITSNASPVAITLPQAVTANNFSNGNGFLILCGGTGTVTITPTTSVINGVSTLVLTTGQGAEIVSDGTNYYAVVGASNASGTVTSVGSGNGLTGGPITTSGTLSVKTTHTTKTTGYSVLTTDNGIDFDNIGAGGSVTFTLPTAAANLGPYGFLVDATQTVEILCASGDKIAIGTDNSAATGNIQSNAPFSFVRIQAHKAGQWVATTSVGTWTVT